MANPFKSIEKKIRKGIESLGNEVMSKIRKVGSQVEGNVKSVGHQVESGVKDVGHDAEEAIEKVAKDAKEDIEEFAEETWEEMKESANEAAHALMEEFQKGLLNKLVDGLQVAMPTSTNLKLGPFVLGISDWTHRINVLQRWASNPPSSRNDLRAIIEELTPSSVTIVMSASVAFVVIQTDSLEFGVENTYETADFLDKFDTLLAHYGITI